jgi:hypothetical protein
MILTSLSPVQCAKSCAGCSRRHGYPAPSKTAGLRQCYEVIALVSGAVPQALHCLDLKPGKLPEGQGPPGSTGTSGGSRTAPSHTRNSSLRWQQSPKPHLQLVPNQLPTRLINVKYQRPSPGTSAQLHVRRARNQLKGMPGRIVREVPKEVLPQALLSDAVAVRASPKSAVKGRNL